MQREAWASWRHDTSTSADVVSGRFGLPTRKISKNRKGRTSMSVPVKSYASMVSDSVAFSQGALDAARCRTLETIGLYLFASGYDQGIAAGIGDAE
jgi:hypothetical protein